MLTQIDIKNNFREFFKINLQIFLPVFFIGSASFFWFIFYNFNFTFADFIGNTASILTLSDFSYSTETLLMDKCLLIFIVYYNLVFFFSYLATYLSNAYRKKSLPTAKESHFFQKKSSVLFTLIEISFFWLILLIETFSVSLSLQEAHAGIFALIMAISATLPLVAFSGVIFFTNIIITTTSTKIAEYFGKKYFLSHINRSI